MTTNLKRNENVIRKRENNKSWLWKLMKSNRIRKKRRFLKKNSSKNMSCPKNNSNKKMKRVVIKRLWTLTKKKMIQISLK